AEALYSWILLESAILSRPVTMDSPAASNFLSGFSRFVTGSDAAADSNLVSVMVWTYSSNRQSRGWPPEWLSQNESPSKGVVTNRMIGVGLDYFIKVATSTAYQVTTNWTL